MIPHSRPWITDEDCEAVVAVLRSGMLNEGAATRRLEQWFEHASGGGTAVATGSGSQALLLALRALEVGAGAEVILPTYVCAEVLGVVESLGATARLVDIADDYLINANATAAAITPRTRAIIVPYVMGIRTDIEPLRTHGVPIIEDLAQWLGPCAHSRGTSRYSRSRPPKSWPPERGGMAMARTPELAQRLVQAKRIASSPYKLNLYPLSDLQATLALSQLERLSKTWERRQMLAQRYIAGAGRHARYRASAAHRARHVFPLCGTAAGRVRGGTGHHGVRAPRRGGSPPRRQPVAPHPPDDGHVSHGAGVVRPNHLPAVVSCLVGRRSRCGTECGARRFFSQLGFKTWMTCNAQRSTPNARSMSNASPR